MCPFLHIVNEQRLGSEALDEHDVFKQSALNWPGDSRSEKFGWRMRGSSKGSFVTLPLPTTFVVRFGGRRGGNIMITAIICWLIAVFIFLYPRTPEANEQRYVVLTVAEESPPELVRQQHRAIQKDSESFSLIGAIYAAIFLVLCNWFGVPVFGGSHDDAPGSDVVLDITPMATPADAQLEPLAFNEWLHAQPYRAEDPSIIKWLDRALAPIESALDIAHAKPYRIVSIESFPSNDSKNRNRLYVHAPEAATPMQRAQTAIQAALTFEANYHKRREYAGAVAWEIEVWLVASAKKTSTYAAWLSYYREGKTIFGENAGYIMDVQVLNLPYSQMVDGENYFADMDRYLLMKRATP
jgi:hypothetical protein